MNNGQKFKVEKAEITNEENGEIMQFNVLSKIKMVNVVDAETGQRYGLQPIAKNQIWFSDDEKRVLIDLIEGC